MAVVQTDVAPGNEVVEPVADNFSDEGCDDGSKVEISDLCGAKVVERSEEDGKGSVDANDPGEGKEIVDCGDEDDRAGNDFYGAHE